MIKNNLEIINNRSCDGCTKCCEGWLDAKIYGHDMYPGRPCHFKSKSGCSIYENRPEHPCKEYSCVWIKDLRIPEWMKPDHINAIISKRKRGELEWLELIEAGSKLDAKVLSWFFMYCIKNNINFCYSIDGGNNFFGSPDFLELMTRQQKY